MISIQVKHLANRHTVDRRAAEQTKARQSARLSRPDPGTENTILNHEQPE